MPTIKIKVTSDAVLTEASVWTVPEDPQEPSILLARMGAGELTLELETGTRCRLQLAIIGPEGAKASATVTSGTSDLLLPSPASVTVTTAGQWAGVNRRLNVV